MKIDPREAARVAALLRASKYVVYAHSVLTREEFLSLDDRELIDKVLEQAARRVTWVFDDRKTQDWYLAVSNGVVVGTVTLSRLLEDKDLEDPFTAFVGDGGIGCFTDLDSAKAVVEKALEEQTDE